MNELLHHFGVNWKLLLAQVVNFSILFFVLKTFAYGPILEVLRNRKKEIEDGLRMSAESKETLGKIKILEEEKMLAADKKALAIVTSAEDTAKKKGDTMMEDAKKKTDVLFESAHKTIEQERGKMADEFSSEAQAMIQMGLEKVIGKIDFKERDKHLVAEALSELKTASSKR
jgi:F-type H+-transporting ATPase subunit b